MNNQVVQIDPRQALCAKYYRDPSSDTFGNLKGSMVKAGYSVAYASTNYNKAIKWIEHIKGTVEIIQGAERNLKKYIEKDIDINAPLTKSEIEVLKIQQKSSEFALKNLASKKYSDNQDKQDAPSINVNIIKQYNINAPSATHDAPIQDAEVL